MPKVLVCDDENARASDLGQKLRARLGAMPDFEVLAMSPADFLEATAGLETRQLKARDRAEQLSADTGEAEPADHPFDSVDALFVDYDLLRFATIGSSMTRTESGERVCYLARCYSRCGSIVAYNQFNKVSYRQSFDLTLRGHLRSFADLNISRASVNNAGLWNDSFRGFRPWAWPVLQVAWQQLNARTESIVERLDEPILTTLGLDAEHIYKLLTREQLEFISPAKDPKTATFRDFVVDSANGLRPRDEPWDPRAVARIAAARISKWLERAILPNQNILVDGPHLVSRYPSLLREATSVTKWNATCRLTVPPHELGLDNDKIADCAFGAQDWLSRPAWLWPDIALNENIAEVRDPWTAKNVQLAFCEDTSRFKLRGEVKEFVAEVAPEFARRYVQVVKNVEYAPAVRLLVQA
jgi:hypothetical protein